MSTSIFTKIINREIPAEVIYEDEHTLVIPDKFPSMKGQIVVVTKKEAPYIFDLDDVEYQALMDTVKKMSKALDSAFNVPRTCMIVEGFEVPHVHVRLYPCPTDELVLTPRKEVSDAELKEVANKVREALAI